MYGEGYIFVPLLRISCSSRARSPILHRYYHRVQCTYLFQFTMRIEIQESCSLLLPCRHTSSMPYHRTSQKVQICYKVVMEEEHESKTRWKRSSTDGRTTALWNTQGGKSDPLSDKHKPPAPSLIVHALLLLRMHLLEFGLFARLRGLSSR